MRTSPPFRWLLLSVGQWTNSHTLPVVATDGGMAHRYGNILFTGVNESTDLCRHQDLMFTRYE